MRGCGGPNGAGATAVCRVAVLWLSAAMRLPALSYPELEPSAKELWDDIVQGRRGAVNVAGGLPGPFNALLYSPRIGGHVAALGDAIRFDGVLDDTLRELAIVIVAAFWGAEFAVQTHARLAQGANVDQRCIDAIVRGQRPPLERPVECAVHDFTRAVLEHGGTPEAVYEPAVRFLGESGVVELTALIGYYSLVSFTLNVFEVPPPA